jgi:hypothetical protein
MSRQRELTITLVHGCLPRLSIAPSGSEALQRHVAHGLLQECEDAELLIVERHRASHLASIGLGTLTRHLIDHAPCQVMITPQSDDAGHPSGAGATEPKITTES